MPEPLLDPAITASRHRWALAARGALALLVGLWLLLVPIGGRVALAAVLATLLAVDGVLALVAAFWGAGRERPIALAEALAGLLLATAILVLALPSLLSLVWIVAAWAVCQGAADLLLARGDEPWLAVAGAVSVAAGIVLVVMPAIVMRMASAPSLVTMVALYGVLRGLFLLAAAGRRPSTA